MADTTRATIASGTSSAAVVAPTASLRLIGFSIAESAVVPAACSISLQESTATDLTKEMAAYSLPASGAAMVMMGEHGIPCPGGIFLNRPAGSCRVVVYYRIPDYGKDSGQPPGW